jgi:predicted permease
MGQSRLVSLLEAFARDIRRALRSLRHRPGFTFVVVLSLALGIGANTAIFSLVDAILLRPLPIPHADQLVAIDVAASKLTQFGGSSYLDYTDFRSRSKSLQDLAVAQSISAGMSTGQGDPQVVFGLLVSGSFFPTLEVQPSLGRDFRPEEDEAPGKYPVAIISHTLWDRTFGQDPAVIGKQVKLNGRSFTIVGVTPKWFSGPDLFFRPDIYVPTMMAAGLTTDGLAILDHRSFRGFEMRARLKPGVTVAQAQAEMDGIMRDLEKAYPDTNKDSTAYVRNERQRRLIGNGFMLPAILMGLVVLVLLIACANVANLLLARASTRHREIGMRAALGAGV